MRITVQANGWVAVDDHGRKVAGVLDLGPGIETLVFDDTLGQGYAHYAEGVTTNVQERDFVAEAEENNRRRLNNLPQSDEPIYRTVAVHREPQRFNSWAQVDPFYALWDQTPDAQPAEPDPEQVARLEAMRQEQEQTLQENIGPVPVADLKAMTRAELRDWYEANIQTNAQVRRVVRWLFLYVIRRL